MKTLAIVILLVCVSGGGIGNIGRCLGADQPGMTGCPGDCDGNWDVTVAEVVRCVSVALDLVSSSDCLACDRDTNGSVTVDELVLAINRVLTGCGEPPPPTVTPTDTPTATPTPTDTRTESPTPTATVTSTPALGPVITHLGLTTADDIPLDPEGVDALGRPIFQRGLGQSSRLVVEARPGENRRPVGTEAFRHDPDDASVLPDLQVILSQPLGNGSAAVCDLVEPDIGGVPAMEPFEFTATQGFADAVNDLGCRVDDGYGIPRGRRGSTEACTRGVGEDPTGYGFIAEDTTVQFCLPLAFAWSFQPGDTTVAARVRDVTGVAGEVREIVVRVSE